MVQKEARSHVHDGSLSQNELYLQSYANYTAWISSITVFLQKIRVKLRLLRLKGDSQKKSAPCLVCNHFRSVGMT